MKNTRTINVNAGGIEFKLQSVEIHWTTGDKRWGRILVDGKETSSLYGVRYSRLLRSYVTFDCSWTLPHSSIEDEPIKLLTDRTLEECVGCTVWRICKNRSNFYVKTEKFVGYGWFLNEERQPVIEFEVPMSEDDWEVKFNEKVVPVSEWNSEEPGEGIPF